MSSTPGDRNPVHKVIVSRHSYGKEPEQFGELFHPGGPGPYPTVILIHGGFWRNHYGYNIMTGLAQDLATRGFATWNIEYRRIGDVGGGWPGTLQDVATAADFLHTFSFLDPRRIVAIGHSAGGHLALWLAAAHQLGGKAHSAMNLPSAIPALTGIISLAGVSDLEMCWRLDLSLGVVKDLLGGSPSEVPERYAMASPATLLPLRIPQVLIHGTEDTNVPYEMSQSYAEAARKAGDPVSLITLNGVEHFALIDPSSAAWAKTVEALQTLLATRS